MSGLRLLLMLLVLALSVSVGACRHAGIVETSSGFCLLLCPSRNGGNGASAIFHSDRLLVFFAPLGVAFFFSSRCLMRWWSISVAPVRGGTYFSLPPQRKVGKRKRLEAPAKRVPQLAQGSGASGIWVRAQHALVTRASYFQRRRARRSVLLKTNRQFSLVSSGRIGGLLWSGLRFLLVLPLVSYALCTNARVCSATVSRSLSSVIMW